MTREAAEAKARKEREQKLQRDRMLIETYLSVADIERLRDQRLELLAAQYRVTEQNINNLRERRAGSSDRSRASSPTATSRMRHRCPTIWPKKWSTR